MDPLSAFQRNKIRRLASEGSSGEPGEEGGGEINVVPFLDIITNVLMFVLATLAITFTATIDTSPPKRSVRGPTEAKLDLTVLVVEDGFSIKARGGNVAPGCVDTGPGLAVHGRDFEALRACVSTIARIDRLGEHGVTISANPNVPYDVIIAATDALRTSVDGEPLFTDVLFAIAR
jgi:biopolymer transport protein TolR